MRYWAPFVGQLVNRQGAGASGAHPRSDSVAIHFADRRSSIRIGAVWVVDPAPAKAEVGVTGVSMYCVAPGMNGSHSRSGCKRLNNGSGVGPLPGSFMQVIIIVGE